jgi:hypothetical protein
MTIDTPTIADLGQLIAESKPMHDEMGFVGSEWQYDSMVVWWTDVLTKPHYDIVVAREAGRIVGVSVVYYTNTFLWFKGPVHANELAHHASPDLSTFIRCKIMIKMLEQIIVKMKARGAEFFKIAYVPKPQFSAWGDYLRSKGFTDSNHVLIRRL